MSVSKLLLVIFLLSMTAQELAAVSTLPTIQSDRAMGIQVYTFLWTSPDNHNQTAYELRVYLRATCQHPKQKGVLLRGFAGAFPIEQSGPGGLSLFAPHFQPPALRNLKLQVISAATSRTTQLRWLGPSNHGLWRFKGAVQPVGGEMLTLVGSLYMHHLSLHCNGTNPQEQSPLPTKGLWNVVTTTSANHILPETLAYLLQLHMTYHERIGFNGTILRCNKGEAQALSVMPHIEYLVAGKKLILWPWVHEHSIDGYAHFLWQKPRNQLTLLAAYGTDIRLSFFDLDEYLVLPQGGTINNSSCMGKPLLDHMPAMSFSRYSTQSCTQGVEKDCWADGQALPLTSGLQVVLEKCPCQFHKPLVQADHVLTLSVHFVWARGSKVPDVPHKCGFLMHLHALVHKRSHFMPPGMQADHMVEGTWVLPDDQGSGLVMTVEGRNAAEDLQNTTYCAKLRNASLQHVGDHVFSVC